ncbi:hypothetical protein, partial [Neisseria meningitidis]|uniref:hypothetical protein n=1 Tax=Neisseria meningitidis TaxID=487 RepID=UPI001C572C61
FEALTHSPVKLPEAPVSDGGGGGVGKTMMGSIAESVMGGVAETVTGGIAETVWSEGNTGVVKRRSNGG